MADDGDSSAPLYPVLDEQPPAGPDGKRGGGLVADGSYVALVSRVVEGEPEDAELTQLRQVWKCNILNCT